MTTLREVKEAYANKLAAALNTAEQQLRETFGFSGEFYLSPISPPVLEAVKTWPPELPVWEILHTSSNNCRPRNFHVAMYNHKKVYGVAFGRVSKGRTHVRIDYMEGHPGPHPWKGKVHVAAVLAAMEYAHELGAKRVLLTNPKESPILRERYAEICDRYIDPNESPFTNGHFLINLGVTGQ